MMRSTILCVLAITIACACRAQVGPFVPAHAKVCSYDGDCPSHYTCRFPHVDSRAVCMVGDNSLDKEPAL